MAYIPQAEKHKPWGLRVPGRPPTPSEGAAQQYNRVGPRHSQRLFTFENGTCLEYGPDDPVDEFDFDAHPFINQIAVLDKAIRDVKSVRDRYQKTAGSDAGSQGEVDPFDDFRSGPLDFSAAKEVALDSGIYYQVPSRLATISNFVSVHSLSNKSDVLGEKHPGVSPDTRFGTIGKPPFDTVPRKLREGGSRGQNIPSSQRHHSLQASQDSQHDSFQVSTDKARRRGHGRRQGGRGSNYGSKARVFSAFASEQSEDSGSNEAVQPIQPTKEQLSRKGLINMLQMHAAQDPQQDDSRAYHLPSDHLAQFANSQYLQRLSPDPHDSVKGAYSQQFSDQTHPSLYMNPGLHTAGQQSNEHVGYITDLNNAPRGAREVTSSDDTLYLRRGDLDVNAFRQGFHDRRPMVPPPLYINTTAPLPESTPYVATPVTAYNHSLPLQDDGSTEVFNTAGRTLESTLIDMNRLSHRIGSHTASFGENRSGSVAGSSASSDGHYSVNTTSGHSNYGYGLDGTGHGRNISPAIGIGGFRRVNAIDDEGHLWDSSRASSPGLNGNQRAEPRGRPIGHASRDSKRSVSGPNMRMRLR